MNSHPSRAITKRNDCKKVEAKAGLKHFLTIALTVDDLKNCHAAEHGNDKDKPLLTAGAEQHKCWRWTNAG